VHTRDTAVQVRGVLRCAKNQNCTHTHVTRFGNTAGLPVPVLNPRYGCSVGKPDLRYTYIKPYLRYTGEWHCKYLLISK
jgi:hypothetical protein